MSVFLVNVFSTSDRHNVRLTSTGHARRDRDSVQYGSDYRIQRAGASLLFVIVY